MYLFWFIPIVLAMVIAIWVFYHKVMTQGGRGVRKNGKVLVDKPGESGS